LIGVCDIADKFITIKKKRIRFFIKIIFLQMY